MRVVLEHQFPLEGLTRSPKYTLVTNIVKIISMFTTMASYIAAKTNIYRFGNADWAVFNWDDPLQLGWQPPRSWSIFQQPESSRPRRVHRNRLVWRDGHSDRVFADTQQSESQEAQCGNILAAAACPSGGLRSSG